MIMKIDFQTAKRRAFYALATGIATSVTCLLLFHVPIDQLAAIAVVPAVVYFVEGRIIILWANEIELKSAGDVEVTDVRGDQLIGGIAVSVFVCLVLIPSIAIYHLAGLVSASVSASKLLAFFITMAFLLSAVYMGTSWLAHKRMHGRPELLFRRASLWILGSASPDRHFRPR